MSALAELHELGYVLLPAVFSSDQIGALLPHLELALQSAESTVLRSRGQTYGSRDLVRLFPQVCDLPRQATLTEFLKSALGPDVGLVRALYFDKPPERSWSLPWHKDRTIAVKDNGRPTEYFRRPTLKAGIPHVEAPESLLAEMVTLRIHLDPMTADNGPLSVMPGSHRDCAETTTAVEIHADAGDVLAMRPLLSHSSSHPKPGTTMHRRIIHLEFAPRECLPEGFEWHAFHAVNRV